LLCDVFASGEAAVTSDIGRQQRKVAKKGDCRGQRGVGGSVKCKAKADRRPN